ncbi:Leucine rich repeat protein [Taphrina deformans PYCC 5710]|uniref:Leucine rich repeat protein n=1 Tax=Taphrina deformans (strain PYCC 5710 / ATCC 11124 / CBS 356.35 / IMI 108563 / JCM 9778 / NBRC 8474) TaxID=1097556 RepID=R4X6R9_TAPDE|nr:Leucine rich repeat protein [Taphrina deformans PYCC 5710]|eukprot:CCG80616.1 Leucine rich repeat protein [Taphrina deformans PYCC 5710]
MDGDAYIQALTRYIQKEGKRLAQRNPDPPVAISLHHLYYLLTRIDDLEVPIGPLNIRLEDLNRDSQASTSSSSNYVSFRKKNSDAASIRSVSSIRSVMSTVGTSVWTGFGVFGSSIRTEELIAEDLKQLYSAFCKLPTLRICPNPSIKLINGFEEYPFDTAVPLLAFKNLQFLEIFGYSPKQFYGWDEVSEQVRSLVVKRCGINDVALLTIGVVKEELEKKRRKAERATRHWQSISDNGNSVPSSPRPTTQNSYFQQKVQSMEPADRPRSASPNSMLCRPNNTSRKHSRYDRLQSSTSLMSECPPPFVLPPGKWRFLRFLSLSDNALSTISVEALAPLAANLNFLDLSRNNFTTIPAALATLSSLRSLDMAKNQIESLHSLLQSPLPGISTLNLRANKLATIAGIDRLPSLERVDLRENQLRDPTEVARLNAAPNFSEMWIAGNPFTRTHYDHRTTIFNVFRANSGMADDITLDGRKPGILEKRSLEPRATESVPPPSKAAQLKVANSITSTPSKLDAEIASTNDLPDEELSVKLKKKVHKSRVIDLSSPGKANPGRDLSTSPASRHSVDTPAKAEMREKANGEEYRKKIEALKQEVGSGWIRVINEDSFRDKQNEVRQE